MLLDDVSSWLVWVLPLVSSLFVPLIATGATLNFVTLASAMGKGLGEAFLVLAFSTDTAVSAVILALLVIVSKKYGTSDISEIVTMADKTESEAEV